MHTCNFLGSKKTTAVSQKNRLVPWNCDYFFKLRVLLFLCFSALRWFGNSSVPTLQETPGCLMGERCEYCARASRLNVANTLEKLDLRFVSYCRWRLASLHFKIIWSIQMPSYACPTETACFFFAAKQRFWPTKLRGLACLFEALVFPDLHYSAAIY